MTALAPATWWRGLGGLARTGSSIEALAWALYDFANTIFSFAIVSFAMSLWAIRFLGEADGTFWFTAALSISVLINAAVSPILGAMSDRVGRRKPFLAVFTVALHRRHGGDRRSSTSGSVSSPSRSPTSPTRRRSSTTTRSLPDVAKPIARGRLSGIGVALGYCGTLLVGVLLLAGVSTDADGESTPATFALVARRSSLLFAAPLFLVVREQRAAPDPSSSAGDACGRWASSGATIRHAQEAPGLLRFIVARFFYSDPVNTAIAVMSAFAVFAVGFTRGRGAPGPSDPDRGGGDRELRLGLPRGPMGPAPDALRGPRHVGRRPRDPHAIPVDRSHS